MVDEVSICRLFGRRRREPTPEEQFRAKIKAARTGKAQPCRGLTCSQIGCDKPATYFVWYDGCELLVAGVDIAYRAMCTEHAANDLCNGREG